MAQASEGTAEAAAGATGGVSHLPWQQVPKFTPGVTSVDEYSQRLRFLKELWPAEHLSLLAPRAALLVEGAAFQKVSRIKPEQLRGPDGVKYLVESLGGSWGKTTVEERYHFFEQAIFQTQQKADESNDSYIARHDAFFEELLSRGVTLEEIRAYVLLRHSLLAPEDKKRVIVEAKGDLKYQETVRAVRLLGSKFFTDFQNRSGPGNAKAMDRSKVYDIHMTTDDDTFEEVHMAMGQDEDLSDELILAHFLEANDEDAIYITEFEDQIVEAVQESELAPVFASCQEARQKLRDKAKSRGFWPIKGKMKGKGQSGKRGKGYGSWDGGRRRSLADRIANSNCKQCGAKGHWKRECPKNDAKPEATLFAQIQPTDPFQSEVLQTLPDSEPFNIDEDDSAWTQRGVSTGTGNTGVIQDFGETCFMVAPKVGPSLSLESCLARRLLMIHRTCRTPSCAPPGASSEAQGPATAPKQAVLRRSKPSPIIPEAILVATVGTEGVLDTGASRTVLGDQRVREVISGLAAECRGRVRKIASDVTFRFGNSGTLTSKFALLLPTSEDTWVRVEVIPGNTPLLISNRLLRDLDAVIHVKEGYLMLGGSRRVDLRWDERGLSIVNLSDLLHVGDRKAPVYVVDSLGAHPRPEASSGTPANSPVPSPPEDVSVPPESAKQRFQEPQNTTRQPELKQTARIFEYPSPSPSGFQPSDAHLSQAVREEAPREDARGQSGRTSLRGGGCAPGRGTADHGKVLGGGSCPPTGDCESSGMGPSGDRGWQAQRKESRENVRDRPVLLDPHGSEVFSQQPMGTVVQELCPDATEADGQDGAGEVHDQGGGKEHQVPGSSRHGRRGERWVEALLAGCHIPHSCTEPGQQEEQSAGGKLADAHCHVAGGDHDAPGRARKRADEASGDRRCRQGVRVDPSMETDASNQGRHGKVQQMCAQIDKYILQIEEQLGDAVRNSVCQHRLPSLDVIEIGSGAICAAVQRCGGRALTLSPAKLGSARGMYDRLWKLISMYEPTHLWLDLQQPWNHKTDKGKKTPWPGQFLLDLYRYQTERGKHIHFLCGQGFLEQMAPQLQEVQQGTLRMIHELEVGDTPPGNNHLRKATTLYTTSRRLQQSVDTRFQTAGPDPSGRSNRMFPRERRLAKRVAMHLGQDLGFPLPLEELLFNVEKRGVSNSDFTAAQQVLKRRRLFGKQPGPTISGSEAPRISWDTVFRDVNARVPKGGKVGFSEGDPVVQQVQALLPQIVVQHVVCCRGTNRIQPPCVEGMPRDMPLRQTVVVKRVGGEIAMDGEIEDWSQVPRYKQMRKGIPAKLSLTAYGMSPERLRSFRGLRAEEARNQQMPLRVDQNPEAPQNPENTSTTTDVPTTRSDAEDGPLIQGYPPRSVPRHGPGYFALGESEKRELVRLHNNLGHPCTETFVRFLQERKAEPALIQGARDYSCSTCLETVPTQKLARPATIHTHRDFNDTIGMDVAYWTNSGGKKFLFTHIVDEGTLFQQASGVGRTPEEQWEFLSDHWFQWAGPCQTLYVDPAGEYNSDYWRLKLQTVGVCTNVSAGEAHWQLGRTEAHGRILKSMLSKMDHEEPILNDEDFRRCLRAAVQAKNSLSRVRGFTPEQAVLGKLSRLPASLISDNSATCHALADSDLPEGVSFRRDLQRREQARVAFIHADNDNSYRRALLRRSRHPCERYEPGDWVLYWRRH